MSPGNMSSPDPRVIAFLSESDAIEGIVATDYSRPEQRAAGRGHWGAYVDMRSRAELGVPLTLPTLELWQGLIAEEQVRFGYPLAEEHIGRLRSPSCPVNVRVGDHLPPDFQEVPALMGRWIDDANRRADAAPAADSEIVEAIADTFQTFEAIHPFVDGNGRVGRLVANWAALRLGAALIVFRAAERPAYYAAHRSKRAMRAFVAGKIREAIAAGTVDVPVARQDPSSDRYLLPDGRERIVERHELLDALDRWSAEERARGRA